MVVSVSVTSCTFGNECLIVSTNCLAETSFPARNTVLTPSLFHFSMKLSSCDCAAVVSVPVMVTIAVDPAFAPAFLTAGTTMSFTRLSLFLSPMTATVLPLSFPVWARRLTTTAAACSLVSSGVSSRPPLASSIHGWSSSYPMWTTSCSLVRHSWPWPVKSMNTPRTANTSSSSAHEVHRESGLGWPPGIGGYSLMSGTILRPSMPPFLLRYSTNVLMTFFSSPRL